MASLDYSKLAISLLLLSMSYPGHTAENSDISLDSPEVVDSAVEQNTEPTRPIEEIQVLGERSLLTMRNQINREEEYLYRMFNDLNSADKFDIRCRKQRTTRSYIPVRSCEPKFLTQLRQQSARHSISEIRQAFSGGEVNFAILQNGLDTLQPNSEIRGQAAADFEALNEEIFRIAMENPDYLASLQKIAELKAQYQAARQLKFGKD